MSINIRDVEEVTEDLYNLNAKISLVFCTGMKKPTQEDVEHINKRLGEMIKKLRNAVNDELSLCPSCECMTHTIIRGERGEWRLCGKCKYHKVKEEAEVQHGKSKAKISDANR